MTTEKIKDRYMTIRLPADIERELRKMAERNWLSQRASLLNPDWKYVPAVSTDILDRFRAMGWVPPSEVKDGREVFEKGERLPS